MSLWAPLIFQVGLLGLLFAFAWPTIRALVERELEWRRLRARAELRASQRRLEEALAGARAARERNRQQAAAFEQRLGADHPLCRSLRTLNEMADENLNRLERQVEEELRR